MTTVQLSEKVKVNWIGYGTYRVEIEYKGKRYTCTSHNSLAKDRLSDHEYISDRTEKSGYTYRQALEAFYEECKQANGLGEYNY